jgi:hypothetical protein
MSVPGADSITVSRVLRIANNKTARARKVLEEKQKEAMEEMDAGAEAIIGDEAGKRESGQDSGDEGDNVAMEPKQSMEPKQLMEPKQPVEPKKEKDAGGEAISSKKAGKRKSGQDSSDEAEKVAKKAKKADTACLRDS